MAPVEVPKDLPKLEEPQIEELDSDMDDLDLDDIDVAPRKSTLSKEASGGRTDAEILWINKKRNYDYDNLLVDLTLIWLAVFEEQNGVESPFK